MNQVEGDFADVDIMLPEDEIEDLVIEEIEEYANSPGATGNIVLMPDTHPGGESGIPVGTTMPLGASETLRVIPPMVGGDIGCGMTAIDIGSLDFTDTEIEEAEAVIRDRLPLGKGEVHQNNGYNMHEDFPWEECESKLERLSQTLGVDIREEVDWFEGYGPDYFDETIARTYNDRTTRPINSMRTLGGGNHFIELSKAEGSGEYWIVIHSGSRGPGGAIEKYWSEKATQYRNHEYVWMAMPENSQYHRYLKFDPADVTPKEAYEWATGQHDESHIYKEAVRNDFEGEEIEEAFNVLNNMNPSRRDANTTLDYLEGEETFGYFIDMIFAQTFAVENRFEMAETVMDVLGAEAQDIINSTHNYIDFEDLVVRKGATRAQRGERLVIPFNMAEGAIIARGKGNPEWNHSAPHGAGRRGSRGWARNELDYEAELEKMEGIQASKIPGDEVPGAYKSSDVIIENSEPTIEIEETLTPVMNLKGDNKW